MAQLSLYMDEAAMESLREDAAKANVSISAYARSVLEERNERKAGEWVHGWPPNWFDLYGSIPDFPDVEELPAEPPIEPLDLLSS